MLLMLGEEARVSNRRLLAVEIARKFIPPIGVTQIRLSLTHLESQGLVSSNFDNPRSSGYQVTRSGLLAIERSFERIDDGESSSYHPKTSSSFSEGELEELAAQGTYVFPVPPDSEVQTSNSVPAPIIIHNHMNPVFKNTSTNTSSHDDADVARIARSGVRAGWVNVLIAFVVGVAGIFVALWIAGKIEL